jgi:hypothetical protein
LIDAFVCLVPRTKFNKGYAFVNMMTAVVARRLHAHLDGHRWEVVSSKKVCDVVHARVEVCAELFLLGSSIRAHQCAPPLNLVANSSPPLKHWSANFLPPTS